MKTRRRPSGVLSAAALVALTATLLWLAACAPANPVDSDAGVDLEQANPLRPLPAPPLGISGNLSDLDDPPTPESVRLGRC